MPSTCSSTFISRCPEESLELARKIAAWARNGDVIALRGELGAGKTVLAAGIGAALGIDEPITSPTFGLIMEYKRPAGGWFFHLDLYRLDNAEQALAFGIEEYLFDTEAITVIEWPDRIAELLCEGTNTRFGRLCHLNIEHVDSDTRKIHFTTI